MQYVHKLGFNIFLLNWCSFQTGTQVGPVPKTEPFGLTGAGFTGQMPFCLPTSSLPQGTSFSFYDMLILTGHQLHPVQ